jgi:ABC-type transport system involved in multi-copper enzyme maturation permease subunit
MTSVFWNPIVSKEVRSRMRSWRAPLVLTAFLAVLSAVGYATYKASTPLVAGTSNRGQVGVAVFAALAGTVMVLVALIVPGLVGGAISGERERQTLDLLLVTPVGPARIIAGKLASSLLFVLLLVTAALPMFSVVFILGGVDLGAVVAVVVVTLVTALALGGLAMLCSVLLRRTTSSTVSSYIAGFMLFVVPLILGAIVASTPVPAVSRAGGMSAIPGGGFMTVPSVPSSAPATSGPPTVMLASPATAMFGALINGYTSRGNSCSTVSSSQGIVNTTCTTNNSRLGFNDTVPDGMFGGWRYWQASSLIDAVLAGLALTLSVLVLRGRWARRRGQEMLA